MEIKLGQLGREGKKKGWRRTFVSTPETTRWAPPLQITDTCAAAAAACCALPSPTSLERQAPPTKKAGAKTLLCAIVLFFRYDPKILASSGFPAFRQPLPSAYVLLSSCSRRAESVALTKSNLMLSFLRRRSMRRPCGYWNDSTSRSQ